MRHKQCGPNMVINFAIDSAGLYMAPNGPVNMCDVSIILWCLLFTIFVVKHLISQSYEKFRGE